MISTKFLVIQMLGHMLNKYQVLLYYFYFIIVYYDCNYNYKTNGLLINIIFNTLGILYTYIYF